MFRKTGISSFKKIDYRHDHTLTIGDKTLKSPIIATVWFLLLGCGASLFAQDNQRHISQFQAGLSFIAGLPQNEFKENMGNTGFGLSGEFAYRLPRSPLLIGGSLGFLIYGHETRKVPFSKTIPDVTVDVQTNNSILIGHLIARLQPYGGTVRPYLDGLLGFNYFWTETSVRSEKWHDDDDGNIASTTNQDDITLSYGGGGGLAIKVWDNYQNQESTSGLVAVFVDLGVHYVQGRNAEYLKEGSIERDTETGTISYKLTESTTDLVNIKLGVKVEF